MKSYMRLTGREVKKEKKKRQERSVESGRASEVIERTIGCVHPREVVVQSLSHVQLFVTPWTVARQAPLSMAFPRQEYRSGLPFPPPRDLPDLGIKPGLLHYRQSLY